MNNKFIKLLEDFVVGEIYVNEHGDGDTFFLVKSIQKNGKAAGLTNEPNFKPSKAINKSVSWNSSLWNKISKKELPPKTIKAFEL